MLREVMSLLLQKQIDLKLPTICLDIKNHNLKTIIMSIKIQRKKKRKHKVEVLKISFHAKNKLLKLNQFQQLTDHQYKKSFLKNDQKQTLILLANTKGMFLKTKMLEKKLQSWQMTIH